MTGTEESFRSVPDPDRLLAELRAETPEMPAGFHASWKRAVGEEMKRVAEKPPAEKPASRGWGMPWRSLAGVAAMMIFLLGGTLLTRGRWTRKPMQAEPAGVQMNAVNLAGKERKAPAAPEAPAAEEAEALMDSAAPEAAAAMEAGGSADRNASAAMKAAEPMAPAAMEQEMVMEAEAAVDWAADAAPIGAAEVLEAAGTMKAAESVEAAEVMEASESVEAAEPMEMAESASAAETVNAAKTPETTAVKETGTTAESAETEKPAAEPGFWEDLGQFILHAWPVPAAAVVLAGAAAWLRKRKKNGTSIREGKEKQDV